MIGVAAFRNRVLVELTNKEKAGTITLYENGVAYTELDGGMSSSGGDLRPKDDPLRRSRGRRSRSVSVIISPLSCLSTTACRPAGSTGLWKSATWPWRNARNCCGNTANGSRTRPFRTRFGH